MSSPENQSQYPSFIVADHSVDPADKFRARYVSGGSFFGSRIWIRHATRSQAFNFKEIVGYRRERLYVVLKEMVPNDPCPQLLQASESAKATQSEAGSADWGRSLRVKREDSAPSV